MPTDEKTIQERKARSTERFRKRAEKEQNIREGRKFFVQNRLPILMTYPDTKDETAVYMTFMPVGKDKLRVAVAMRSRRDRESLRKVRGLLGWRIQQPEEYIIIYPQLKGTFVTEKGRWKYSALYDAFNAILPAELMLMEKTPEWLKRSIMRSQRPFRFQDYRCFQHIECEVPYYAQVELQRFYEQTWPRPVQ